MYAVKNDLTRMYLPVMGLNVSQIDSNVDK